MLLAKYFKYRQPIKKKKQIILLAFDNKSSNFTFSS